MKKMTPEVREALEITIRMPSVQSIGRKTALMLMDHISSVEWEHEAQIKINRQLVEQVRSLEKQTAVLKVAVPQDVAAALEYYRNNSTKIQTILQAIDDEQFTGPNVTTLRNFTKENFDRLLSAMINGYTVEQTPDDYVFEQYMSFRNKGQHAAADALEMAVEKLVGKRTVLLEKMYAVERPLPF